MIVFALNKLFQTFFFPFAIFVFFLKSKLSGRETFSFPPSCPLGISAERRHKKSTIMIRKRKIFSSASCKRFKMNVAPLRGQPWENLSVTKCCFFLSLFNFTAAVLVEEFSRVFSLKFNFQMLEDVGENKSSCIRVVGIIKEALKQLHALCRNWKVGSNNSFDGRLIHFIGVSGVGVMPNTT